MSCQSRIVFIIAWSLFLPGFAFGQQQAKRTYTQADFINVDGGSLNERVERAFQQFKSSGQGETLWIAYHFPAREGVSYGPFTGMIYRDNGIRLERRDDPAQAAVFLLTDATGSQAKFKSIRTLNMSEPYVFEDRPVYWLGNVDAAQSISLLEGVMRAEMDSKVSKDLPRGALRAIAVHDNSRVIPLLKEVATKETNTELQRSAVSNLARVKTPESLDVLIDLYDNATVDSVKEEIIGGIARDESRKATDKLLAIAKNDPNPKMRQRAIRRLSSHRGRTGIWIN
jgi:HEAT repeats